MTLELAEQLLSWEAIQQTLSSDLKFVMSFTVLVANQHTEQTDLMLLMVVTHWRCIRLLHLIVVECYLPYMDSLDLDLGSKLVLKKLTCCDVCE